MEIERKYLIDEKNLPADLESCRSVLIEQGYLCRKPVVRIRRQDAEVVAQAAIKKKASEDKTFELMEADLAAYAAKHKATTEKRFTSAGGEVPQFGSYTELYKL